MNLNADILNTLRDYAKKIQCPVQIKLYSGEHPKREQLIKFLQQVASTSDLISFEYAQTDIAVREGMTFELVQMVPNRALFFPVFPEGMSSTRSFLHFYK